MIWYSYKGVPYFGNCPAFYDLDNQGWFAELKKNITAIQKATTGFLQQTTVGEKSYFNTDLVEGNAAWKVIEFLFWGEKNSSSIEQGKEFYDCFKNTPGLVGLAISRLPAHTTIKPHYGDTDGIYRLHIPVVVPAALPACGLRVNGQEKAWTENNILVFCDAHLHEAWNHSAHDRIVVIADVIREEYSNEKNSICLNVRSLLLLQKLMLRYKWLSAAPGIIKGVVRQILKWRLKFS